MAAYIANVKYVEAMSGILVQLFVPSAGYDDLVNESAGQVIDTEVFHGLNDEEAARILKSQVSTHRKALAEEERKAWIMQCVNALPPQFREKTFALFAMRIAHSKNGKPSADDYERLEVVAELLDVSSEQSAKIMEVCNLLACQIV